MPLPADIRGCKTVVKVTTFLKMLGLEELVVPGSTRDTLVFGRQAFTIEMCSISVCRSTDYQYIMCLSVSRKWPLGGTVYVSPWVSVSGEVFSVGRSPPMPPDQWWAQAVPETLSALKGIIQAYYGTVPASMSQPPEYYLLAVADPSPPVADGQGSNEGGEAPSAAVGPRPVFKFGEYAFSLDACGEPKHKYPHLAIIYYPTRASIIFRDSAPLISHLTGPSRGDPFESGDHRFMREGETVTWALSTRQGSIKFNTRYSQDFEDMCDAIAKVQPKALPAEK